MDRCGVNSAWGSASACDIWVVPARASTAVYAIYDANSPNNAILYRIDLTALATAATPSTGSPGGTNTAAVLPAQRHAQEKQYMLQLINAERAKVGAAPVILGTNVAAQLHAESNSQNCIFSHWGVDGLKPYMRYTLAGGYQLNAENASGYTICATASDRYTPINNIRSEIDQTMNGYMESPGHRRTILDPVLRKVNIGLSWNRYQLWTVQHFEGDYFVFDQLPTISGDTLTFSGSTKHGALWAEDLAAQMYFDPPPHSLTRGQLGQTYCANDGELVALIRDPLPAGYFYDNEPPGTIVTQDCVDPYQIPGNASVPRSRIRDTMPRSHSPIWITASRWQEDARTINGRVDLSALLDQEGAGVYTLVLWGYIDGQASPIAKFSMFHRITPPTTYG